MSGQYTCDSDDDDLKKISWTWREPPRATPGTLKLIDDLKSKIDELKRKLKRYEDKLYAARKQERAEIRLAEER